MKTSTKTLTTYTPYTPYVFINTTPGGTAVKRSFLVNDVTEFTGNLKPVCVNGAFPEKRRNVVTCVNSTFFN